MKRNTLLLLLLFYTLSLIGQEGSSSIKINIIPNSKDWKCRVGEKASFKVSVTQNRQPINNVEIRYELSIDMMDAHKQESLFLKNGEVTIEGGTMTEPGFLRCRVFYRTDDVEHEGMATVGYDVKKIEPMTKMVEGFLSFWRKAVSDNRNIEMKERMRLLPERCTTQVNVYEISFENWKPHSRMYGILSVPKKEGKYPAIIIYPGAGVRPYKGDISNAEKGIITLEMGIHGIPVTLNEDIYEDLRFGGLDGYCYFDWDSKDRVYYKRVYLGCVKAVDFVFSLPQFDGNNLVVSGGSQGGALSVVTAALDSRVKGAVVFYPALSDLNAFLNNRTGGWPHLHKRLESTVEMKQMRANTIEYYDVVNFAKHITVPIFFSFGYNDVVCPPTTSSAVLNSIKSDKEVLIVPEIGHYTYPEMIQKANAWMYRVLKINL